MVFINVVLSFIFQRFCLCVTFFYRVGYLLEGEMSSSLFENQTTNLKNVYTDISIIYKNLLDFGRFKEQYTIKRKEEYSCNMNLNDVNKGDDIKEDKKVTKKKPMYYKHVIFDCRKWFWGYNIEDLTFLQAFEFTINGEQLKIPGIIDKKKDRGTTNFSQLVYEMTFERCLLLVNILISTYCKSRYLDFEKFENEYHNLKEPKNKSGEKEFDAKKIFLNQLKILKNYDCILPKCPELNAFKEDKKKYENEIEEIIKSLKVYFAKKFLKALVGDKKEDDEKIWQHNLKVYTQRYYDLMNEIGKFLKRYDFTNYSFIDKEITFTMKKKKIIGFYLNFEEEKVDEQKNETGIKISQEKELNTDEWFYVNFEESTNKLIGTNEGVETKENENSVKSTKKLIGTNEGVETKENENSVKSTNKLIGTNEGVETKENENSVKSTNKLIGTNEGVETKENENSVKKEIKYSNIIFFHHIKGVVTIDHKSIEIYKNSGKQQFLVVIDMEKLRSEEISVIFFEGTSHKVCVENVLY